MSDPSETGGRPLASSIPQPEASTQQPSLRRKRRQSSQSSDERVGGTKSTSSTSSHHHRRRPGTRKEALFAGPHTGSSRGDSSTMQPSASPTQMSPDLSSVAYTRTGRISKAKKGRKVHNCECGRSYTRAEHLRRHQKNHAQEAALVCNFPDCGKSFYRIDLLQRHQERHNEIGKDSDSRRPSTIFSPGGTAEPETQVSVSVPLPLPNVTSVSQGPQFYTPPVSSLPESAANPRYTSNQFRTPQIPSSAFGHILRSSPTSKSTFNLNLGKRSYPGHLNTVQIPMQVQVEGLSNAMTSFSPSPNCSSSSGYASPIPGAGDYSNMFANPPYGAPANRTRTSSNASFIQPWEFPSRSPTSATSTMAYTWTSNDKSPAPPNLGYLTTSYPMAGLPLSAGVDPMAGYGHFGPKSLAQRDEEEQAFLFPEQSFGMGQIAHTYPFEHYLDNYWRLFHPSFPVVHRPTTVDGINEPPMLQAAMIAVGGQYSNDPSVKRKSRILHDRCMKLLDKRNLDVIVEPERLCDQQALFLVEVLSQYRARRAAKTLSTRFEGLYQKLCQDFSFVTSNIIEIISALVRPENATFERWSQWIELSGQQRLLLCCYILEYQQATLLARSPRQSLAQLSGFDLPFPAHSALWDAENPSEWAMASQQYSHLPTYVCEVDPDMSVGPFDCFQSSLLIASHYNYFNNATPYLAPAVLPAIEHLLDGSSITKHHLITAKLLQVTPIRALLAVSGESWILSEKIPSHHAFSGFKGTLRTWVNGLWTPTNDSQCEAAKDALKLAIELLQHAMITPVHTLRLELGADMGLYFAALVIWAVTVAANARINAPQAQAQALRYQSHSPLPSTHFPSTPTHLSASTSQPSQSPNPTHATTIGLLSHSHTSPALPPTSTSMLHSEITMNTVNFLNNALLELDLLGTVAQWPRDVAQWQQGCAALMRWVKMRLRNGALEGRDSVVSCGPTSAGTGRGGDGLGELLDGVIGVLEKIMNRGWEGWSF
ncbi:hypothetical protein K505DRAFT_339452 [Melanomma pulvis-pyrius CBS 109.77]|uniref:C2H2-type domain-containing protein n=1 Tax=Melanomma pulvis-pyrius CBS 109.77 TaxID=1314802 RepID=A0A6A6X5E8_9PLEO|nr:hypothetical protein K505DRAFT_339452 [Melanomma pulvis-pyrius CBS 109.77]